MWGGGGGGGGGGGERDIYVQETDRLAIVAMFTL